MALTDFAGTVAVITGGASGIGLATARALYAKGAHVVLADINSGGLQQAAEQVHQQNPEFTSRVLAVPSDVTDEAAAQDLMRQAKDICGRIDLVMTSAGVGNAGPVDALAPVDVQRIMNINFIGTYHCVYAALPTMRQQQSGHFVFMSSVAGKLGVPLLTAYCASKWAVRGFSHALRAELYGTSIGITTVYPAWVDTPMVSRDPAGMKLLYVEILLTPDQVANEILQAVTEDRRDLTLAPNTDIAKMIQLYKDDPDKAEMLSGQAFYRQLSQLSGQSASREDSQVSEG